MVTPGSVENQTSHRLDYQMSIGHFRELVGVRFRLLGLVPTVSGVVLAGLELLELRPANVIGPALIGLLTTAAIAGYEVRNSQIHDNLVHRLRHLERLLDLEPAIPAKAAGGFYGERTHRKLFLLPPGSDDGRLRLGHDAALAIIYGTVLAAWATVLTFNLAELLWGRDPWSHLLGGAIGLLIGLAGWRAVSALSQTGRNVGRVYLLKSLVDPKPSDWCRNIEEKLLATKADPRVGQPLTEKQYGEFRDEHKPYYALAIATGVVRHRRRLKSLRLKNYIEALDIDPTRNRKFVDAVIGAVVGMSAVDIEQGSVWKGRRRLERRFGPVAWSSEQEVRYRAEWLSYLRS